MRIDFKTDSNDNALFTTAQCNNNCLMCCQPPLKKDDIEELYAYNIDVINRAPKDISVIGITGGEPTLLGERLLHLIEYIRGKLPNADIHLLSNGRNFKDIAYAQSLGKIAQGKLFVGVPLHSDYYRDHDTIAAVKDAFNETIAGIFNLAAMGIPIELRIAINKLNYNRLPRIADFIHKNLPFVAWTAFMGMEYIGHAVSNEYHIWIEPIEYADKLEEAVLSLAQWRQDVAIYNIPLCLIQETIHPYAQKSISDWKMQYLQECDGCSMKSQCCGLFATSRKPFNGLKKI